MKMLEVSVLSPGSANLQWERVSLGVRVRQVVAGASWAQPTGAAAAALCYGDNR